jgi:uncharacterized Rossmann fold enzyme
VAQNKQGYSKEEYNRAVLARKLYVTINRPSLQDFIKIVATNQII